MGSMTFLRNRDVSTGRPPGKGNATSFAGQTFAADTVGSLVPPVSDMDTAEWLVRNDLSLPGPAFERMQAILHGKRIVSPRDRADAFEQAFHEYHGYDYQTDLNARAGLAALEDAGHDDFAEALRAVLNARLSPGRATAPGVGTDELGAFVEEPGATINDFNKGFYVTDESGIFYELSSDEAPPFANHALLQADRDLTLEESDHVASLLAYAISAVTHDRRSMDPYTAEGEDAIAQRSADLIPAHQQVKIAELLEEYVAEGTPVRSTDRSGPGTAGTRAIDGFGADAPRVRVLFALNNS